MPVAPFSPSSLSALGCLAACLAAGLSAGGIHIVRGSTAVPAAAWAAAGCLALAGELGARAAGGLAEPSAAAAAVRLIVVALAVCPAIALLGAKRPQHGVWQLIVATLAVVLAFPAFSALLVRPGSRPDVHLLERCFMPLLVLAGWMNFAGTRRAPAATCAAAGQLLLLRGFLPGVDPAGMAVPGAAGAAAVDAAAAGLLLVAAVVATGQAWRAAARRPGTGRTRADLRAAAIIDPPFLAIRETLGAAWALRIAERFDSVAAGQGWPCRLRFHGLETSTAADQTWERDATQAFRALVRRFVDDSWLARHGWPVTVGATREEAAEKTVPSTTAGHG